MKRVLIISATGTVGGAVRQTLIRETDAHLTLFARHRIVSDNSREDAVTGDVKDPVSLEGAVAGQDIVFAALSGDMADYARSIVAAMEKQVSPALYSSLQWGYMMRSRIPWAEGM